jgi:hypothetical protein
LNVSSTEETRKAKRIGIMERWKNGTMEEWKDGRMEGWYNGTTE